MKTPLIILILLILSGCASHPTVGNLVKSNSASLNTELATEAAAQLRQHYAPAATTFVMHHPVNDDFGQMLVQQLRDQGFAVAEFDSNADGQPLGYVVDYAGEQTIWIKIRVGQNVISRLYQTPNNSLAPLGNWSRLE